VTVTDDKRSAWLKKLDEECPYQVVLPRRQLMMTARSRTFSARTLASSTCTSKIGAPPTRATASRSRWTPRSSGRASGGKASRSGSRVDRGQPVREETDAPLLADRRNFFKVELWTRDGLHVERLLFAGNNLDLRQEAAVGASDYPAAEPGRVRVAALQNAACDEDDVAF
jgi:hypothetical protein